MASYLNNLEYVELEGLRFYASNIIYPTDCNLLLLIATHLILCKLSAASLKGLF